MLKVWTVGHSVHPIENLIEFLKRHGITANAHVRSMPKSRFNPQFNQDEVIELMAEERKRQSESQGYTAEHDDRYTGAELSECAICYVSAARKQIKYDPDYTGTGHIWPLDGDWWKPGTPIQNLVKAGALVAAEIDRQLRAMATVKLFSISGEDLVAALDLESAKRFYASEIVGLEPEGVLRDGGRRSGAAYRRTDGYCTYITCCFWHESHLQHETWTEG